ncbi:hypothetical protein HY640_00320 [Candidatus Woesearchaeota archaeon]|nr:hypothetical protein [Candidatus Woesearchaeota archaeon]
MRVRSWHLFAVLSGVFFALQASHFSYSVSDENTYIYMGMAVSGGLLPYRDFFLAHPPLHVFFLAGIYSVFGFNFLLLKASSPLMAVAAGFLVFRISMEAGPRAALLSAALFYFSYDVLRFSTYAAWINLASLLVLWGVYLVLRKKDFSAGLAIGAACLAGIISVIGGLAALAYLFMAGRGRMILFAASFLGVVVAMSAVFVFLFGNAYLEDVFYYHLAKPFETNSSSDVLWHLARLNPLLFFGAAVFLFSGRIRSRPFFLSGIMAGSYVFVLAFLISRVLGYYFLMAFPFIAVVAGVGLDGLAARASEARKTQAMLGVFGLVAVSSLVSSYYYWSNDFQDFEDAEAIASFVRDNSEPGQSVFGDDSIVPLVAILSGRDIALGMIDSNSLRWRSGLLGINDTIRQLKNSDVKFVVERRLNDGRGSFVYGVSYIDTFKSFLRNECVEAKVFRTAWRGYFKEYYVYDCSEFQHP